MSELSGPDRSSGASTVADAARAALAGGLIVVPTDTVYGIGCLPFDAGAVERLFEAKQRPRRLELPVLVPSAEAAVRISVADDRARLLMERFWPGALTLVLSRSTDSRAWPLGGDEATIGVRMPAAAGALELLSATGPLAVTSANRSGVPTPASCDEIRSTFGTAVAAYLCDNSVVTGRASCVVDLTAPEPRVLREGALAERVLSFL
ncbi:MAG: L-threonylcarbamoyladenylate synthase [Actinomycetota bacterium]|nr:L-threonylcarbamoyladenylate synthase [Actinomycetota bacterium]